MLTDKFANLFSVDMRHEKKWQAKIIKTVSVKLNVK